MENRVLCCDLTKGCSFCRLFTIFTLRSARYLRRGYNHLYILCLLLLIRYKFSVINKIACGSNKINLLGLKNDLEKINPGVVKPGPGLLR
jgi:hypothetical protein